MRNDAAAHRACSKGWVSHSNRRRRSQRGGRGSRASAAAVPGHAAPAAAAAAALPAGMSLRREHAPAHTHTSSQGTFDVRIQKVTHYLISIY